MRILLVAMPFSIHTARWISQLNDSGWEIHLFPSMPFQKLNDNIKGIVYHQSFYNNLYGRATGNVYRSEHFSIFSFITNKFVKKIFRKFATLTGIQKSPAGELARIIKKIKPDIVHSLETQHAGYLTLDAKKKLKSPFPFWIHSTWGIDLHYYGQQQNHLNAIKDTLANINLLIVEGNRDLDLARQFGYKSRVLVFPSVGGGFHIDQKELTPPSRRKKILIKGMHDHIRRGLTALQAVESCIHLLQDYELILYSANEITTQEASAFFDRTGKPVSVLKHTDHQTMMLLNSEARINICINLSDGLPNSMLEAMLMGAFPVQSDTSVAGEWVRSNETGMLVSPGDKEAIGSALRLALTDDALVDRAAIINRQLIKTKLEYNEVKESVLKMYKEARYHNN